ncbi:MAG: phosphate butyryltransferase [Prevotella sp.]|nr:phosphate butyryltransferase [Prevotella sp.]
MKNFDELTTHLRAQHICRRVAVVSPRDASTIEAVHRAAQEGFITPLMIEDDNLQTAAERAVTLVQEGQADMLMKGLIPSEIILKAILRYNGGLLPEGRLLTHVGCAHIPGHPKLLLYTDAAVIPFPTHEQRIEQVKYIIQLCHALGIEQPRVSLIHCSEEVDERHFPYTPGYREIVKMAQDGVFGPCLVDGPLDLKTSCSPESMQVKGIHSPIAGNADALIFPNIETGNVFHKAVTLFGHATLASILLGPTVPVVLPSRADTPETKFLSLALAATLGANPE